MNRPTSYYFLLLSCLLILAIASGQTATVKGKVYDKKGKYGICLAVLSTVDSTFLVETDHKGRFKFKHVPYGNHVLRFTYFPYYRDTAIQYSIGRSNKNVKFNIALDPVEITSRERVENINVCPICHSSDDLVPIVHGMLTRHTYQMQIKKLVVPGGCLVSYSSPAWFCKKDNLEF